MAVMPKLVTATLGENGLRVIAQPLGSRMTASIAIAFPAGSWYETRETNGSSHFLEHMIFRGGKKYANEELVTAAIAGAGADTNAYTSDEFVSYHIIGIPSGAIEVGFDVLSDMILYGRISDEAIGSERDAILQELAEANDNVQERAESALRNVLYADSPLRWDILGPKENILRFSHEDLSRFRDQHYVGEGAVLAVAGDVESGKVFHLAERYFGRLPQRAVHRPHMAPFTPEDPCKRIAYSSLPREQTWIFVSVPAPKRNDPDVPACEVLSSALGGHMGARLFLNARSKLGLAYSIWAYHDPSAHHGFLQCYTGVDPANATAAVRAIVDTCLSMTDITAGECERTRNFVAGQRMRILESTHGVATHLAESTVCDSRIRSIGDHVTECDRVAPQDVQALAEELFQPEYFKVALAGPVTDATIAEILERVPELS